MRCQAPRWAHSTDPRHETEQQGYDLIGDMIKRRRLGAGLTQRRLEDLTDIDQTVISRLENGKQYGLRWSRFAILVAILRGLDGAPKPPEPWWIAAGIKPPAYLLDELRRQELIPAYPNAGPEDDQDDDHDDDHDDELSSES